MAYQALVPQTSESESKAMLYAALCESSINLQSYRTGFQIPPPPTSESENEEHMVEELFSTAATGQAPRYPAVRYHVHPRDRPQAQARVRTQENLRRDPGRTSDPAYNPPPTPLACPAPRLSPSRTNPR